MCDDFYGLPIALVFEEILTLELPKSEPETIEIERVENSLMRAGRAKPKPTLEQNGVAEQNK